MPLSFRVNQQMKKIFHAVSLLLCPGFGVQAQTTLPAGELALSARQVYRTGITAGQSASVPLVHDATLGGGDMLSIRVSDPNLAVSVTLPGGAVITDTTAAASGFTWSRHYVDRPAEGLLPIVGEPGHHHTIIFPPSLQSGTYVVQLSAAALTNDCAVANLDKP